MRISGGIWRNRTLKVPDQGTRPTSDKVRQAIFNMLNARGAVVDAVVCDAFCGSGALGLEALSQGAQSATLWDKSPQAIRVTKDNAETLDASAYIKNVNVTALAARPDTHPRFTLVFIDPPYDRGLIPQAIERLRSGDWVEDDALFVLEMAEHETPDLQGLVLEQEKIYGDTKVWLVYNAPV